MGSVVFILVCVLGGGLFRCNTSHDFCCFGVDEVVLKGTQQN